MGVPQKAIVAGEEILKLIPQRAPFVFVDSYYGEFDGAQVTGFTPVAESLFTGSFTGNCKERPKECDVEELRLTEAGVIENMAQSAAAVTGYQFISRGESVPVGFIGAVSKFVITEFPLVGKEIITHIRELGVFGDISLVEAVVFCEERRAASAELKIFLQK
ncbi:MAG: hydroxymyristoyl-ACP dehydratase [Bacteroidales bacterium]|nr:hydroxymyristoyl-ACP dehydratase [Bacteroidales bacterium]